MCLNRRFSFDPTLMRMQYGRQTDGDRVAGHIGLDRVSQTTRSLLWYHFSSNRPCCRIRTHFRGTSARRAERSRAANYRRNLEYRPACIRRSYLDTRGYSFIRKVLYFTRSWPDRLRDSTRRRRKRSLYRDHRQEIYENNPWPAAIL